jgi:hypothetical protein
MNVPSPTGEFTFEELQNANPEMDMNSLRIRLATALRDGQIEITNTTEAYQNRNAPLKYRQTAE